MKFFEKYSRSAFFPPGRMREVQTRLLRQHLAYCQAASPFYRKLFRVRGIVPDQITLDNLQDIPLTDKRCLERSNNAFLAVPRERVADIVLSSGTTGVPTKIVYSGRDLERLAYNERQSLAACGIGARDRVLLTCTIDRCFVAGLAYYLGARAVGAACIRNGLNNLESHAGVIKLMSPSVIVGVPSFLRKLGMFLESRKISVKSVKRLVCIGEPLRDRNMDALAVTKDIEAVWKARAYSTYSSSV